MSKEDKLNGITPKCLEQVDEHQERHNRFLGANGKLYPCCMIYIRNHELEDWAERNNMNTDDIDVSKHSITDIAYGDFYTKFYNSFDTEVCRDTCSTDAQLPRPQRNRYGNK